jgi:hypothetical protein
VEGQHLEEVEDQHLEEVEDQHLEEVEDQHLEEVEEAIHEERREAVVGGLEEEEEVSHKEDNEVEERPVDEEVAAEAVEVNNKCSLSNRFSNFGQLCGTLVRTRPDRHKHYNNSHPARSLQSQLPRAQSASCTTST